MGKGLLGEWFVGLLLKFGLPKNEYFLLNDVTLPAEGGSTQIDHVVVSQFGVFVIETKNMKGWIFGSEDQAMWTQSLYRCFCG